jgi:hypothetical protein
MTNSEHALLNFVDYGSMANLRGLYKNLNKFKIAAEMGNTTAQCVVIDLMDALVQLDFNQRVYLQMLLVEGYTLWEVAVKYNKSSSGISWSVTQALCSISKYLIGDDENE